VQQSHQLAAALAHVKNPPISHIYSSPFYRCLQTIQPLVEGLGGKVKVRGDNGLGYVDSASVSAAGLQGCSSTMEEAGQHHMGKANKGSMLTR
jgi:phosphohistidine phosphatase SixA